MLGSGWIKVTTTSPTTSPIPWRRGFLRRGFANQGPENEVAIHCPSHCIAMDYLMGNACSQDTGKAAWEVLREDPNTKLAALGYNEMTTAFRHRRDLDNTVKILGVIFKID